jgi:RNA polymerase sigma-70 factor (ECF subfamily)
MDTLISIGQHEMVTALKQRSAKGFDMLYDNYAPVLYGVVCRIVNHPTAAEDILQDIFVKVWNNIDQYSAEKGSFFTWLMGTARNTAIDYLKSAQFKQSLKSQPITENENIGANWETDVNMNIPGIHGSVARLEPKYRIIIDLVYIKGYTHEQTAAMLALPPGTVKTRARMAFETLKKHIGE